MKNDKRLLIDWVSFTLETDMIYGTKEWMITRNLDQFMHDTFNEIWDDINASAQLDMNSSAGGWERRAGRAPYAGCLSYRGFNIYYSTKLDTVLIEITGRGCDYLREIGRLDDVLDIGGERLTRIDLAVDIKCDVMPIEFTEQAVSGRFKSNGIQRSDSGETVYIGSRKSERYARVYRYFKPHPRHEYLRCEFVYRKKNAKIFYNQYKATSGNLKGLALGSGNVYGFEHPAWDLSGDDIDIKSYTPERRQGKTLAWLVSQVAPAFKKLVDEGVIEDPEEFIRTHFLSE